MIKILILRNDHIGDMVYSTPIFREIKKALDCKITVIASKQNKPIIEKNPHVDRIIELGIPTKSFRCILQYLKMSFKLRKEKFDIGIDLRGSNMNAILLKLSNIKKTISHTGLHSKVKYLVNQTIQLDKDWPIYWDNEIILQEGFNVNQENTTPEIITDELDKETIDGLISDIGKYICICPIASLPEKQWPLENFKELINWLRTMYPKHKILLLGINKDRDVLDSLLIENSLVLLDVNVRQLPLLFQKSDLVLGHDGGPIHSSWISGAKTIALYPQKIADKFYPLNNCEVLMSKSQDRLDIPLEDVKKAVRRSYD